VRRRLLASYVAIAALVLVLLAVPLAISYADRERDELVGKVERDAIALATLVEDALEHDVPVADEVRAVAADYDRDTGGRVVVVDRSGTALVDSSPTGSTDFGSRPEVLRALAGEVSTGTRSSETLGTSLLYVAVPVASGGVVHGAVRVTYPTSAVDARIHRYWTLLAAIAAAVLAASVATGLILTRWVVRPLDGLQLAARTMGGGDLTARAPVDGPPEVRRLSEAFNAMGAQLEALVRSQNAFVADASHQLRTPLAALRLRLENLERDVAVAGRAELDGALTEVERLSRLVDALLTLARADRAPTAPRPLALEPLVDERMAAWAALAEEREVRLRARTRGAPAALATPGRIEQVLDNLLANALDASPPRGTITVEADAVGPWVELRVTDEGPGMSAEDRTRAFDRFWRSAPGSEGFGLGLAIVRRLVRADGGAVELREAPSGGLQAVVRLRPAGQAPLAAEPLHGAAAR
jgi:signal transduction histidine kinase